MEDKNTKSDYTILFLLVMAVIVIYGLSWIFVDCAYDRGEDRGTFGDKFGAVNALFSGLAFAGLIYTIILQRKELSLQREELQLTRKEMEDQTAEFEKQNRTLLQQTFENTFFQLLNQFETVTNNLEFSYMEDNSSRRYIEEDELDTMLCTSLRKTISGRDMFRAVFEDVPHYAIVRDSMLPDGRICMNGMRRVLGSKGMKGYMDSFTPSYFDHYFRLMYRILKFIDRTTLIRDNAKYEYACILRALLSRYELVWLYYNGLSDYGCEKFKPLIEKYAMLQNLRNELLVRECKIDRNYSQNAYRHD